jgi:hypothetical protein
LGGGELDAAASQVRLPVDRRYFSAFCVTYNLAPALLTHGNTLEAFHVLAHTRVHVTVDAICHALAAAAAGNGLEQAAAITMTAAGAP